MTYYPSSACKSCKRGVIGRFGEAPPMRCPACEALFDRRLAFRKKQRTAVATAVGYAYARWWIDAQAGLRRSDEATAQRNMRIACKRDEGLTLAAIAESEGVTKERIRQILMQEERRRKCERVAQSVNP